MFFQRLSVTINFVTSNIITSVLQIFEVTSIIMILQCGPARKGCPVSRALVALGI